MADASQSALPGFYMLDPQVMDFAWGACGDGAFIPEFLKKASRGVDLPTDRPAAELWMGAHPRAPSSLVDLTAGNQSKSLFDAIQDSGRHILGTELYENGVRRLPFLFKILDAAQPLSIQAHPDKRLARALHAKDPKNYPDSNHKPELAICLHGMRALMGFRRPEQISDFFRAIPELGGLCTTHGSLYEAKLPPRPELLNKNQKRGWLKFHYSNLMRSSRSEIREAVHAHLLRLDTMVNGEHSVEDRLFIDLVQLYGEQDAGVFCVYFLNYIELEPEQALYLGPNEPHAYLSGLILECMAASDNVVRAGLTQKFQDTETLIEMLHYNYGPPLVQGLRDSSHGRAGYKLSITDFKVFKLILEPDHGARLITQDRPAVFIVLDGEADLSLGPIGKEDIQQEKHIKRGDIIFTPGDLLERNLSLRFHNNSKTPTRIFQATVGGAYRE